MFINTINTYDTPNNTWDNVIVSELFTDDVP